MEHSRIICIDGKLKKLELEKICGPIAKKKKLITRRDHDIAQVLSNPNDSLLQWKISFSLAVEPGFIDWKALVLTYNLFQSRENKAQEMNRHITQLTKLGQKGKTQPQNADIPCANPRL
mmetsp:Transcript_2824/g.4229  ORF Transcript_2824/g.4229 Transcript_2824/m.4229 type:complete len:119 (+) Transcript_2824:1833-2189(+)